MSETDYHPEEDLEQTIASLKYTNYSRPHSMFTQNPTEKRKAIKRWFGWRVDQIKHEERKYRAGLEAAKELNLITEKTYRRLEDNLNSPENPFQELITKAGKIRNHAYSEID